MYDVDVKILKWQKKVQDSNDLKIRLSSTLQIWKEQPTHTIETVYTEHKVLQKGHRVQSNFWPLFAAAYVLFEQLLSKISEILGTHF